AYRPNAGQAPAQAQAVPQDSGVVVMIPGGGAGGGSGGTFAAPAEQAPFSTSAPIDTSANQAPINTAPINNTPYSAPAASAPTGIPSSGGGLSADEQLDGPVLA